MATGKHCVGALKVRIDVTVTYLDVPSHTFTARSSCLCTFTGVTRLDELRNKIKCIIHFGLLVFTLRCWGPGVAQWLRRWTTSRTVPASIPGGVTGFFSDILPSDRPMALESTQPLVEMSTRNIPGCRRPVREADDLITFTCRMSRKSGGLNLLEHSGPHRACYGTPLPLPFTVR
jgi:hypothetical protein